MKITAVILAAGMSRRMHDMKILLPVLGKPMIQHVIELAIQAPIDEIILVVGYRYQDVLTYLSFFPESQNLDIIINSNYKSGMASSLQTALDVVSYDTDGLLVMLADMPLLPPAIVQQVIQTFEGYGPDWILVPTYQGQRGHPVLFGSHYFKRLSQLQGDVGGRLLLSQYENRVLSIPVDYPEILRDFDTLEQWKSFQTKAQSRGV